MVAQKRAVIFSNGEARSPRKLRLMPDDFLIAADGGLRHLRGLGLTPHLLVGDFDSISAAELEECRLQGVEISRFPSQKDQTDLELALNEALARGYRAIVIAFGLGGRLDHTLGSLALLSRPDLQGAALRFEDGETVFPWRGIPGSRQPGDVVSLLPWNEPVDDIWTEGLLYPLKGESLLPWQTRGVSNLCTAEEFGVSHTRGALLVVRRRVNMSTEEEAA